MSMFRTTQKMRNIITLFHDPANKNSAQLASYIVKTYSDMPDRNFDLEITENSPTVDQIVTLAHMIPQRAKELETVGLPKPTLVSWFTNQVAVNDLPASQKILDELSKKETN